MLQSCPISNRDVAPAVIDHAGVVQSPEDDRHALASHAQHGCEEFVAHRDIVAISLVLDGQQSVKLTLADRSRDCDCGSA